MSSNGKKLQYNRFCLRPIKPGMNKSFFAFNCQEIQFLVPYLTIMSGCYCFAALVLFALGKVKTLPMIFLVVEFLFYVLGHYICHRNANLSPYCLFMLFTLT